MEDKVKHSNRVFMVPTHRPIERTALKRHVAEIENARQTLGERIPLVIVENRSDNQHLISEVAAEHPQLDIYRLDDSDIAEFQEALKRQLPPPSRAALDSISDTGVLNYGNVFNRMYLVASAMGAQHLHRRDSDTYAQKNEGRLIPPLELEMSFLGEVDTHGMPCFMVGGGYTGKWSIDIDHLIHQTNREPAYRFFRTLSIEPEDFNLVFEEHIQGNASEYIEDRLEFNSKKSRTAETWPCTISSGTFPAHLSTMHSDPTTSRSRTLSNSVWGASTITVPLYICTPTRDTVTKRSSTPTGGG